MLAKKMARVGVAWKLVLTLGLGYLDLVTDLLVAKSYFDAGDLSTAYATVGFAVLAIVLQGLLTFFNYWKKVRGGWRRMGFVDNCLLTHNYSQGKEIVMGVLC